MLNRETVRQLAQMLEFDLCGIAPVSRFNGMAVNQKLCRENSESHTKKGYPIYVCNTCRKVRPNDAGQGKRLEL